METRSRKQKPAGSETVTIPVAAGKVEKKKAASIPKKAAVPAPKTDGKLKVGDKLPAGLSLQNEEGDEVNVLDLTKAAGAVIFMYPKANTPGCTKQACLFRDSLAEIQKSGYEIYGLSTDNPKPQRNWREKHNLGYSLLCDPSRSLIKSFGAAKAPAGTKRSVVIVAKGGTIEDMMIQISPGDSVTHAVDFLSKK